MNFQIYSEICTNLSSASIKPKLGLFLDVIIICIVCIHQHVEIGFMLIYLYTLCNPLAGKTEWPCCACQWAHHIKYCFRRGMITIYWFCKITELLYTWITALFLFWPVQLSACRCRIDSPSPWWSKVGWEDWSLCCPLFQKQLPHLEIKTNWNDSYTCMLS